MLSSISSIYKQKKDEVTTRGEEWHKQIEKTVKKLHQELDDMQKEHETQLKKQETEYEELLQNLDQINRKATSLQKSQDVKEMQTFIPLIKKHEAQTEITHFLFPTFYECKKDANYLQTYFGYVENMVQKKTLLTENKLKVHEFPEIFFLDVPTIISVIDTGLPASEQSKNRLYDMTVTDDSKVWTGRYTHKLKLFDLKGNLSHTFSISCNGMFICMYNKQVLYSDISNHAVKKISDTNIVVTMFTTGDWDPRGITSTASGDLLVSLCKDNQFKVVRYSSTGTVLQEIQYDSQCQPLYTDAKYITENVNGDIIITDWKQNTVIAVDRLGIFRYTYSGKDDKFDVCSVAHDSFGHVIVTDYTGDNIHMLDIDGQFLRYLIPDGGINRPRAVCIIGHGEMVVGECLTGKAKIIKYLENSGASVI